MTEIDLRITGEIQALKLQCGDIVVVKVPAPLTFEHAQKVRSFVKERIPQHDVLVLGDGIDIMALTAEDFIAGAEHVGKSGSGQAARAEVASAVGNVMSSIDGAQKESGSAIEKVVGAASRRLSDQLGELIQQGRQTFEEIRKLRR